MRRHGMLVRRRSARFVAVTFVPVAGEDPVPPPPLIKRIPASQPIGGTTPAGGQQLNDDDALKQAGLSAFEAAPLLEYLKARTLTDADQSKIGEVIARFGADEFEDG